CATGVSRHHEGRRLQPLHHRAGPRLRRLSRGPHPRGSRGAPRRLPPVPMGFARWQRSRAICRSFVCDAVGRGVRARERIAGFCSAAAVAALCGRRSTRILSRKPPLMNVLSNLAVRDVETLVHPYTNLAAFRDQGPLVIERAKGVYVYDTEGKDYIEGMAGLWCTALGYGNEELVEAAAAQMRKL